VRVRVTFPDGRVETVEIDPCRYKTVEEMSEDVCAEMADKYLSRARFRSPAKKVAARRKYIEGCVRWLYPSLLNAIYEYVEKREVV